MGGKSVQFNTKSQVEAILSSCRVQVKLPKKSEKVIIDFPGGGSFTITVHSEKSTYGKTLYRIEIVSME